MTNQSIRAAFERMWQHIVVAMSGKADANHTHSASDISSGTLSFSRLPTGKTSTTVAIGNHTHTTDEITGGTQTWTFNCGTSTTII